MKRQLRIILRGLIRTLIGSMASVLVTYSVVCFLSVSEKAGYVAVVDFSVAVASAAVALVMIYLMGINKGRYEYRKNKARNDSP